MIYLILLAGFVLRLISINQSLWLDEATTALVARMSVHDIFTKFLPGDFHPPLYYLILKFWASTFGFSEITLRVPSIIFGLGTIYLTYLIAKKIFDQKVGLISSLLVSTSGLFIYYSQEARMYMLAAFLVTTLIYLFINKKWILFSLALMFLGMTDYVALFIIPIFLFFGIKDWKKILVSLTPLLIFFTVWKSIFLEQLLGGTKSVSTFIGWWRTLGELSYKNIALIPVKFIIGRVGFENKLIYSAIIVFLVLIFGYLLYKARKSSNLVWAWLVIPIFIGIAVSFEIPILSYFRFLFCLPAFYILVASGVEKSGRYKNILLSIIILINLATSFYYLFTPKFYREDWRLAAKTIGNSKIITPSNSQKEALIYYGKEMQIVDISKISGKEPEVWLSRYVWEIFDPTDSVRKKIENLGYNRFEEFNFNGVIFRKYTK
ncbi:MAG TPA: glycosyltransferase family 39 protein [Patescibacteria group bacterium]|nr:glycosyltransferase family 39 protein [Patescibacteria group bacterium]